jgi:predicted alpha/beta-hydrolase family hydrolase
MKNGRKSAAKDNDFLVSVAESIGSTLGAVAARVSGTAGAARRRPARRKPAAKRRSVSSKSRRASVKTASARALRRVKKIVGGKRASRKKSSR